MTKKPYTSIEYEDLTVKLYKGKYSPYTYISSNFYTRQAHKYNQKLYICATSQLPQGGWLDILLLKNANRLEILKALKNWKATSRKYRKHIVGT